MRRLTSTATSARVIWVRSRARYVTVSPITTDVCISAEPQSVSQMVSLFVSRFITTQCCCLLRFAVIYVVIKRSFVKACRYLAVDLFFCRTSRTYVDTVKLRSELRVNTL